MDVVADLAVQGGHLHIGAQGCLGEGDGHFAPDVVAPALEQRVGPHGHVHVQVAVGAAVDAGVALAAHIEDLLVVNAGGHGHLDALVAAHPALAVAGFAGGLHNFAGAAAAVAGLGGLHHPKGRALADAHLAGAMAVLAGLGGGARRRAGAVALVAGVDLGIGDGLLAALGRLLKGDGDIGLDIAAAPGGVGVGAPCAAPKAAAKEAVENVRKVEAALEGAAAPGAAAKVGVYPRVAELVVAGPLVFVGEYLVGLVDLFKLGLGVLVPGV